MSGEDFSGGARIVQTVLNPQTGEREVIDFLSEKARLRPPSTRDKIEAAKHAILDKMGLGFVTDPDTLHFGDPGDEDGA